MPRDISNITLYQMEVDPFGKNKKMEVDPGKTDVAINDGILLLGFKFTSGGQKEIQHPH